MLVDTGDLEEHSRLVRRYLAERQSEWRGQTGVARWLARIKLELRAWKYANEEKAKYKHDPKKPYLNG